MNELNLTLAVVGATVLILGLLSRPLNRSLVSLPMLAFLVGVIAGPAGFGWLDPSGWGDDKRILEEVTRLTLAISLMGIALRLPTPYVIEHRHNLAVLLGIGMPMFCAVSTLLTLGFLEVSVLVAMLTGAAVCATDPVIASSIVTGGVAKENLPARFRHTLSAESALNDGLALPLVMIPVLLLNSASAAAFETWLLQVLLWEVGAAVLLGIALGTGAGWSLRLAEDRELIDQPSFLTITIALTLLALGLAKYLGTDGILAVFVTGLAFDQKIRGSDRAEEARVQEAVNLFFTLPVFILFGLMVPWQEWGALGWGGLGLTLAVLAFRRLPIILLLKPWLSDWQQPRLALLAGWFGPIGISALYYVMLIHRHTGNELPWVAGSLMVAGSLVAHGVTSAPLGKWYGRHYPAADREVV